jgi:hypothetical protein
MKSRSWSYLIRGIRGATSRSEGTNGYDWKRRLSVPGCIDRRCDKVVSTISGVGGWHTWLPLLRTQVQVSTQILSSSFFFPFAGLHKCLKAEGCFSLFSKLSILHVWLLIKNSIAGHKFTDFFFKFQSVE